MSITEQQWRERYERSVAKAAELLLAIGDIPSSDNESDLASTIDSNRALCLRIMRDVRTIENRGS